MSPAAPPWRRWIRSRLDFALAGAALWITVAACSNTEATYSFDIKGPHDVFNDAKTVSLFQNNMMVATSTVSAGGSFSLSVGGLQPVVGGDPVVFSVKAFDAANAVVAYGEAPGVELLPQDSQLRIFVQKPGTLARVDDLDVKLKDHLAFESETVSTSTTDYHVTAAVFGFGETTGDVPSAALFIYNPLLLQTQKLTDLNPPRTGIARPESASLSHGANPLLLFGGVNLPDMTVADRLDELVILRTGLADFSVGVALKVPLPAGFSRAGGVLASTNSGTRRMVFGGRDQAGNPIASIAVVDEITGSPTFIGDHPPMAAARDGHTVTVDPVTTEADKDWGRVLIYGGAAAGAPVAELLNPKLQTWLPFPAPAPAGAKGLAHPGTGRRNHQALILPKKSDMGSMRVLIVGGNDDDGNVRGDSIVCIPAEARCEPSGVTLAEPRSGFAAFIVKDDLVVIGGVGTTGAPVASAEIFSATTLAAKAKIDAVARVRPTATTLGNGSTIIIGGEGADKAPLGAVEIYQPYRTE